MHVFLMPLEIPHLPVLRGLQCIQDLLGGFQTVCYCLLLLCKPVAAWHNKFNCRRRGCPAGCPNPYPFFITAYDYINNNPSLSTLATLLDLFADDPAFAPVVKSLQGDFSGTILAPINSVSK
jgi:hypothetical protein